MNVFIRSMLDIEGLDPSGCNTRGRVLLRQKLRAPRTQKWLAEILHVDQSAVSHWTRGTSRPDEPLRSALLLLLAIPRRSWLSKDEVLFLKEVRDAARAAGEEAAA